MKRIPPWLVILIIAPLLGEIVSGHQPPLEVFNPLSFLLLMLPYGFGALICRELVRRWKKGWTSLILLAVAYGVYEEAIVIRSFFNPNWTELGNLKPYYILGINWTYSEMLVHFHVLVSIAAGIILAEMLYPERRKESWLSNKGLIACIVGLALWLPAGWLMTAYVPPLTGYLISWAAILGLIIAAFFIPADFPVPIKKNPPHPFFFLLLGFVNMTLFFVAVYMLPETVILPLLVSIIGLVLLDGLTLWLLLRWSGNGGAWNDRHRLAWVSGGLGFFILFNLQSDFEEFTGRSCVSAITILGLILLSIWVNRRTREKINMSCIILALLFLQACSMDMFDDGLHHTPDAKYVLPYPIGKTYTCTQGFNSNPSHFGSFSYSVDFGMPIGTVVTATRNGRVVYVVESNSDRDQTPGYENIVIVMHEDTTYARYVHLTFNGALVQVNQTVVCGDTVGLSGSSGTNGGSHLHFDVTKTFSGKSDQTIPFYFRNTSPHPNGLQSGVAYKAQKY